MPAEKSQGRSARRRITLSPARRPDRSWIKRANSASRSSMKTRWSGWLRARCSSRKRAEEQLGRMQDLARHPGPQLFVARSSTGYERARAALLGASHLGKQAFTPAHARLTVPAL